MQQVDTLAASALPTNSQAMHPPDDPNPRPPISSKEPPSASRLPQAQVERLWQRMLALYGNTWASQYGTAPKGIAAETWSAVLADMAPEQLAEGLRGCATEGQAFPPSAPRFRAMCLGIPSFTQVHFEIRTDTDRHPFTRLVWTFVDGYALRNANGKEFDRILKSAYELATEKRMRGAPLPPEAVHVEHEDEQPRPAVSKDERHLAALAEALGVAWDPDMYVRENALMAEFGCSREDARRLIEEGTPP